MALLDRLTHYLRRQAAHRRLSGVSAGGVLFVCQGNLCRSPFAEGVFKGFLSRFGEGSFTALSAGLLRPGRTPPREAIDAAQAFGVDLVAHRSRLLSPDLVQRATLIMVMTAEQQRSIRLRFGRRAGPILLLGDLDPISGNGREIPDPWGRPPEVFQTCYDRIDRCVHELARTVTSQTFGASAPQ